MKQHCRFAGCRAWPRRGTDYCVAHPEGKRRLVQGAASANPKRGHHALVAAGASEPPQPRDLGHEIGVVQDVIAELIRSELPVATRVAALDTAASALVRLLRANREIVGDRGDLQAEVDRALRELGLGEA